MGNNFISIVLGVCGVLSPSTEELKIFSFNELPQVTLREIFYERD